MQDGLRKLAAALRKTPLHPQWFAFLREEHNLERSCASLTGTILDVGCAQGTPRRYLPAGAKYVGLDYFSTATEWYGTRPDVFGDAQSLPFNDASIDHVLLLDVLEHIPDPGRCLGELYRVLKKDGSLTIQVPFLYPVHDAPLDYHRWTIFGLRRAAANHGFSITEEVAIGHPLETAALNTNIAMSKTAINWIRSRNPLLVLTIFLPLAVAITNSAAWLFAILSSSDDLMPYAYRMIWKKQ